MEYSGGKMNHRSRIVRAALGLVMAAGALGAQGAWGFEPLKPEQACASLTAEARGVLGAETPATSISCLPGLAPDSLEFSAGSPAAAEKSRAALFPDDSFAGYRIGEHRSAPTAAAATAVGTSRDSSSLQQARLVLASFAQPANFDGTAAHSGAVDASPAAFFQNGPPGSQGGQQSGPPGSQSGPPGSQNGPPGSDSNGPPGSAPQGPPSSQPPSRPAPVWRTVAPSPNWWNTYERDVTIWDSPLNDFGRSTFDPETGSYVSRWNEWPSTFESTDREVATETIERTKDNQDRVFHLDMRSREIETVKQCYYRAHVNYTWVEGGFEGSHWQQDFDHYEAACYRYQNTLSNDRRYVNVRFDMGGKSLLPGERERFEASFDGRSVRVASQSCGNGQCNQPYSPSYQYAEADNDGSNVVLRAGEKLKTYADPSAVKVELVNNNGVIQVLVTDARADVYAGETLEIAVTVKYDKGWFNKPIVLKYDANTPLRIVVNPSRQKSLNDFTTNQRGKYFIDSWAFRRAQSRVSVDQWIGGGEGNSVNK
jgi:hypothetical protein